MDIFIFEYISSGGFNNASRSLLSEGFGMLTALINDFAEMGFKINLIIDIKLKSEILSLNTKLNEIMTDKVELNIRFIENSEELEQSIDNFVKISDYSLFIAPEFDNISFDIVERAERVSKNFNRKMLNTPAKYIKIFGKKNFALSLLKNDILKPKSYSLQEFMQFFESESLYVEIFGAIRAPVQKFIMKPDDGAGCIDTFEISIDSNDIQNNPSAVIGSLKGIFKKIKISYGPHNYIIQKKIDGIPLSVSAINRQGKPSFFSLNRQFIEFDVLSEFNDHVKLSKLEYIGGLTPYDELPEEIFRYILSFLQDFCRNYKFTGFFGIDFIYNPLTSSLEDTAGNIYLIEINPRVTTPYIAYSKLFRKLSENLAGLFFDGNYIQKRNYFDGTCEFKKNQKTGLMDIVFK